MHVKRETNNSDELISNITHFCRDVQYILDFKQQSQVKV